MALGMLMGTLEDRALGLIFTKSVLGGCSRPEGLQAQLTAVPVWDTGLSGRQHAGEVALQTLLTHCVTLWCACNTKANSLKTVTQIYLTQ